MDSIQKLYVDIKTFREDSYSLAAKVIKSGFYPDYLVALWRGGAIPGICMHEAFKWYGSQAGIPSSDHISIRTSKYTGIDKANSNVEVHNLGYLAERVTNGANILIVDDIYDTGHTIQAVLDAFRQRFGFSMPIDIRVATIYYKPSRNQTTRVPDYYIHETSEWVVFPHEVEGMTVHEIEQSQGSKVAQIFENLAEFAVDNADDSINSR